MTYNRITILLLLACTMLAPGCATTRTQGSTASNDQGTDYADPIDPFEGINRKFYTFTDVVDRKLIEPVADVYMDYVPVRVQRSVGNFYDNIQYPNVVLNDFLQGKVRQGFHDGLRFVVNSTIGIAGLFDPAASMGLTQHDEDFGQTLGVWGVDANTYLFVPLLGPSSDRDVASYPVALFTNVLFYIGTYVIGAPVTVPLSVLGVIDKRARLSGPMKIRDEAALEPYLFVRDAYLQQRKHLIYDGNPPPQFYDDPAEEDLPTK